MSIKTELRSPSLPKTTPGSTSSTPTARKEEASTRSSSTPATKPASQQARTSDAFVSVAKTAATALTFGIGTASPAERLAASPEGRKLFKAQAERALVQLNAQVPPGGGKWTMSEFQSPGGQNSFSFHRPPDGYMSASVEVRGEGVQLNSARGPSSFPMGSPPTLALMDKALTQCFSKLVSTSQTLPSAQLLADKPEGAKAVTATLEKVVADLNRNASAGSRWSLQQQKDATGHTSWKILRPDGSLGRKFEFRENGLCIDSGRGSRPYPVANPPSPQSLKNALVRNLAQSSARAAVALSSNAEELSCTKAGQKSVDTQLAQVLDQLNSRLPPGERLTVKRSMTKDGKPDWSFHRPDGYMTQSMRFSGGELEISSAKGNKRVPVPQPPTMQGVSNALSALLS